MQIERYNPDHRDPIIALSLRAWAPVFEGLRSAMPRYLYRSFYPDGWQERQIADIDAFLSREGESAWVAIEGEIVVGWVGVRLHRQDRMGEIYILAVDPGHQREGIASRLIAIAFGAMRQAGMKIVMVETGGDPGHAASRATYERNGFEKWPVARYFREL